MKETGTLIGSMMEGQYFQTTGTTIEVGLNLDILAKFICGARIEDLYRSQPRDTTSAIKLNVNYSANKWAKASLNIGKYILCLGIQLFLCYRSVKAPLSYP